MLTVPWLSPKAIGEGWLPCKPQQSSASALKIKHVAGKILSYTVEC